MFLIFGLIYYVFQLPPSESFNLKVGLKFDEFQSKFQRRWEWEVSTFAFEAGVIMEVYKSISLETSDIVFRRRVIVLIRKANYEHYVLLVLASSGPRLLVNLFPLTPITTANPA